MKPSPKDERPTLSLGKKLVYYLILLVIPIAIFFILELSLRLFHYGYDLRLFQKSNAYPGYYELNQDVAKRFFSKSNGTAPSNDIFLIKKPDTCYRIFVMGCSTTRGFPYEMGVTFTRILYYRLQDVFPNKRIEVVNTAMSAINSFTQADFIDEILAMKPDAILIYTGHNEFYGALGVGSVENVGNSRWLKRVHLYFIGFRTYQLIQRIVATVQKLLSPEEPKYGTLMARIVKNKSIEYKSDTYNIGIEQFRTNMDEVVRKIKNANIPLIFSDVVSNIKMPPFKSVKLKGFPPADSVFVHACVLENEGKFDEARQAYYLAKDLDVIRFRASEDLNDVIYNICSNYKVPVLNMKKVFEQHSPKGIIGYNLMLEHLHPNIDGYFLMADAFFNEMRKNNFISQAWDSLKIKPSLYYRYHWGFTALDSLHADLTIKSLNGGWPFKPESVVNNFLETYKPFSLEDSLAWICLKTDTVSIEDKHNWLAQKYKEKGEYLKAFKEYYSMIKNYPYVPDGYYFAIRYLEMLGDYKAALDIMLSLPDKDKYYSACIKIGKLYQKLNQPLMAIHYYEEVREIIQKGNDLEYMLNELYGAYLQAGNLVKANEILSEIRTTNPNFQPKMPNGQGKDVFVGKEVKPLIENAIVLIKQKRFDAALVVLFNAQKIKETSVANHLIGNILLRQGDDRALEYLEKAHKDDPKDPNILNNLFVIYLKNKDYAKASRILEEYKLVSDDYDLIQRLINMLEKEKSK
jgi:tetratricopeptide (TPR) repeat protein